MKQKCVYHFPLLICTYYPQFNDTKLSDNLQSYPLNTLVQPNWKVSDCNSKVGTCLKSRLKRLCQIPLVEDDPQQLARERNGHKEQQRFPHPNWTHPTTHQPSQHPGMKGRRRRDEDIGREAGDVSGGMRDGGTKGVVEWVRRGNGVMRWCRTKAEEMEKHGREWRGK